jgi:hypothetical protein
MEDFAVHRDRKGLGLNRGGVVAIVIKEKSSTGISHRQVYRISSLSSIH